MQGPSILQGKIVTGTVTFLPIFHAKLLDTVAGVALVETTIPTVGTLKGFSSNWETEE